MAFLCPTSFSVNIYVLIDYFIIVLFSGIEGHVVLDRNPGPVYNAPLLRLIQGDIQSAGPHRMFHTLFGLLDSRDALPKSYPDASVQSTIFMMVFGMTRPGCAPTTYRTMQCTFMLLYNVPELGKTRLLMTGEFDTTSL